MRRTAFNVGTLVAYAVLIGIFILDYLQSRHRLAENGLHYRKLFLAGGFAAWADIRQVRYSTWPKQFLIKTYSGQKIRIYGVLVGLPEFAEAILAHVPQNAIEEETQTILKTVANGNQPPSWWS